MNPKTYMRAMQNRPAEVDMYASVKGENCQVLEDYGRGTRWGSARAPATSMADDLPGRRLWANPPSDLVVEALQLVVAAWIAAS